MDGKNEWMKNVYEFVLGSNTSCSIQNTHREVILNAEKLSSWSEQAVLTAWAPDNWWKCYSFRFSLYFQSVRNRSKHCWKSIQKKVQANFRKKVKMCRVTGLFVVAMHIMHSYCELKEKGNEIFGCCPVYKDQILLYICVSSWSPYFQYSLVK